MLELKHVSFSVNEEGAKQEILRNISLTIDDHKFVVITGPNGGGKTTLAKAIMGIVEPTEGEIFYNGTNISNLDVSERAKAGIAFGFQMPPRFKGMKVRDLMELAAGDQMTHAAACAYLTRVGLCANDYIHREVDASLSGGELKRIEIATVLARPASLLIFDEPEAGIDLWSFAKLTTTFEDLRATGEKTLIVISHQERIINLADEIIVVADGQVAQHGSREEILPQIVESTMASCWVINQDMEGGRVS